MSVAVGIITGGGVNWECTYSLVKAGQAGSFEDFTVFPNTCYLDAGRNALVKWFLEETECSHFLCLDSDISFRPSDIDQLAADDLPCVAGVYYNVYDGVLKPVAKPLPASETPNLEADDPLLEVEATGPGFMMLSRELLEKMGAEYERPMAWFWEPVENGVHTGEDYGFCRRVRTLGEKVWVDLRVQLSHHKTIRIAGPQ